jgi:hypothetical protein
VSVRSVSRIAIGAFALSAAALALPASSGHYRWVDADGTTVNSQTPPPTGEAQKVRTDKGPSAAEIEQSRTRLQSTLDADAKRQEDTAKARETAAKGADEAAKKAAACEAARANLNSIRQHGEGPYRYPDGKTVLLSKEQQAAEIAKAQAQIEAHCK